VHDRVQSLLVGKNTLRKAVPPGLNAPVRWCHVAELCAVRYLVRLMSLSKKARRVGSIISICP
jgi:hypothetical protein